MSKILGPLFVKDKHQKDETTVTASNHRDSTVTFDGKLPWEIFDFPSEEKCSTAVDNDDAENIKPQDSDGFDACFDEGDADSIEPDHDDFWDSPFNVHVKPINDSGSTTDTHNESETLKTHKPSIKETYKDAIYTDKTGKEKINKIKFVDIYINDNSLIIAQDTKSNNDAQLIHIYENGKYTHYSDIDVKRDITRIINELNKQLLSVSEVNDILARIKLQAPRIDIDDFDSDENIINFKNGLVDIRTGTLVPHSSFVFTTIQIPCHYSPTIEPMLRVRIRQGESGCEVMFLQRSFDKTVIINPMGISDRICSIFLCKKTYLKFIDIVSEYVYNRFNDTMSE